jgi:NADPH2:quinone reductase
MNKPCKATMRAMTVLEPGPPENLRPVIMAVPVPLKGQARVRVAYAGMNPIDAMLRRERIDWLPVQYPFVPGIEHSGVVDRIGEGVDPSWLGRRVLSRFSMGGYAEYSVSKAAALIPLDPRIDLKTGCAFRGCSFTAWHALHRMAKIRAGDTVLIHSAAGAVGAMAMQIAIEAKAVVVGLVGGAEKAAFAAQFGGPIVDYLVPNWPEEARRAIGGRGFDIILDGNSGPNAAHNYTLIARAGRVLYIGNSAGSYPEPISVPLLIARSVWVGGMTLRDVEDGPGSDTDGAIVEAVASGRWSVPISEVVPLSEVAALHRRLESRQLMGRAVIRIGGESFEN